MKAMFGVNHYDKDGDLVESCILLHVGDGTTILKFEDLAELEAFANGILTSVIPEIRENYPEAQ